MENILLKSKNSKLIKIVDFGIAGVAMQMNVDKVDVGSLSYMAPEVLSGKATKIGPSIDIWALGVILFGMVYLIFINLGNRLTPFYALKSNRNV